MLGSVFVAGSESRMYQRSTKHGLEVMGHAPQCELGTPMSFAGFLWPAALASLSGDCPCLVQCL